MASDVAAAVAARQLWRPMRSGCALKLAVSSPGAGLAQASVVCRRDEGSRSPEGAGAMASRSCSHSLPRALVGRVPRPEPGPAPGGEDLVVRVRCSSARGRATRGVSTMW